MLLRQMFLQPLADARGSDQNKRQAIIDQVILIFRHFADILAAARNGIFD